MGESLLCHRAIPVMPVIGRGLVVLLPFTSLINCRPMLYLDVNQCVSLENSLGLCHFSMALIKSNP